MHTDLGGNGKVTASVDVAIQEAMQELGCSTFITGPPHCLRCYAGSHGFKGQQWHGNFICSKVKKSCKQLIEHPDSEFNCS